MYSSIFAQSNILPRHLFERFDRDFFANHKCVSNVINSIIFIVIYQSKPFDLCRCQSEESKTKPKKTRQTFCHCEKTVKSDEEKSLILQNKQDL